MSRNGSKNIKKDVIKYIYSDRTNIIVLKQIFNYQKNEKLTLLKLF